MGVLCVQQFEEQCAQLFQDIGESRVMVLATSLHDHVTSRAISVVVMEGKLYFQTDKTFRKYEQLINNPNVSLSFDQIQIDGSCRELGSPNDHPMFCEMYRRHFAGSYGSYSMLANERLFEVTPRYIQRWLYEGTAPFVDSYDFINMRHVKKPYIGE